MLGGRGAVRAILVALAIVIPGLWATGGATVGHEDQPAATPVACEPGNSLLLVQRLMADLADGFAPDLSVFDTCGTEVRRIELPGAAFIRPTARSGRAIVHAWQGSLADPGAGPTYLVDAATGEVMRLPLPEFEPTYAWDAARSLITMGSDRWMLVGHTDVDPQVHLLDLDTGESVDLLAALPASLGDIGEIEYAVLLPGDEYVFLDSWNGPFVIPTADPARVYRIGELDEVANASLAPDGRRLVYTRNTESGTEEAVLTGIDLAAPEVIAAIPSTKAANELFARFLADGAILFESPERAWLLDPASGKETTLPPGAPGGCEPIGVWAPSASGRAIAYSLENGGCGTGEPRPREWWFFDRVAGEGRRLPALDGYEVVEAYALTGTAYPGLLLPAIRSRGVSPGWMLLGPDAEGSTVVPGYPAMRRLMLETGEVTDIPGLPAGEGFVFPVPDPTGRAVLFTLLSDRFAGETYLFGPEQGPAHSLGGTLFGAFSPDGVWLALTEYIPRNDTFQTRLMVRRLADGATFDLGEGIATWLHS